MATLRSLAVRLELSHDTAGDLRDLKRMGQPSSIEIAVAKIEDLGLALQSSKRCGMDHPRIIRFEHLARIAWMLLPKAAALEPSLPHETSKSASALSTKQRSPSPPTTRGIGGSNSMPSGEKECVAEGRGRPTRHQLDTEKAATAKLLILWRSLGESNPCFSLERAKSDPFT
jgi:hypothetical protein